MLLFQGNQNRLGVTGSLLSIPKVFLGLLGVVCSALNCQQMT